MKLFPASEEARLCAQMMEHHLLQSTLQGALDHVIEKHPANPNPKKTAKRRRLRKKADQPKDLVELAQVCGLPFSVLPTC